MDSLMTLDDMRPIRIDENSTTSALNTVFGMQPDEVFSVAPEFLEQFIANIPEDRYFKFRLICEGSTDYKKYGSDCYKVVVNVKTINF